MKYSYNFCLLLFIFIAINFYSSCKKNPVESPFNVRHLTWSIDTLAHPDNWQYFIDSVWGNSADDVYAVGIANTPRGILWRYTMDQWFDLKINGTQGGPIIGAISFDEVFGFAKNDVWVCGDILSRNPDPSSPLYYIQKSLLIHWDGVEWKQIKTPEGNILESIWGPSPNNIWIGGVNGTIFHYDGAIVKKDTIPLNIPQETSYWNILSITGNESETYMLLRGVNPLRFYLLTHQNEGWVVEDSSFIYDTLELWMSPSGTLYAAGESFYKRQGKTWEKILDGSTTLFGQGIYGTSENNLFVVGNSFQGIGAVYHFDGSDWLAFKELEKPGVWYCDVWTDGKEVFITGRVGSKTIVLHGK